MGDLFLYGKTGSKVLEHTDISTQEISNTTLELIWSPTFQGYYFIFYLFILSPLTHIISVLYKLLPPLKEISPKVYLWFHFLLAITQMVDIHNMNHQGPWGSDFPLKMVTVTVTTAVAIQPIFTQCHYPKIGSSAPSNHCKSLTLSVHKYIHNIWNDWTQKKIATI